MARHRRRPCRHFPSLEPLEARQLFAVIEPSLPPRQVEFLNRGMVAFNATSGSAGDIYVGWRMLGTDPQNSTSFDLYCSTNGAAAVPIATDITSSTNFVHAGQDYNDSHAYFVVPTLNGAVQSP